VTSRPTLRTVAGAFLDEHTAGSFVRGSGLQRSDCIRLCLKFCRKYWERSIAELPRDSDPLTAPAAEHAASILAEHKSAIAGSLETATRVITRLDRLLTERGTVRRRTEYGEMVISAVGTGAVNTSVPDAAGQLVIVGNVLAGLDASPPLLPRATFAERYVDRYEQLWAQAGADNLDAHAPSRIGLGSDERPLLVSAPYRELDHNWFLGSDRSIYDRYRLHAKRSAASRSVQARAAGGPAGGRTDLAELEVWRACQPYGLAHQEHRVALRSLYVAISAFDPRSNSAACPTGTDGPSRTWKDWRAGDTALSRQTWLDASMIEATSAYIRIWRRSGVSGWSAAERFSALDLRLEQASEAAVRKLWMDLFRCEREQTEPARSGRLAAFVGTAFDKGVAEALARWEDPGKGRPAPDATRTTATRLLLEKNAALRAAVLADPRGRSWAEPYEQAARSAVGPAWVQTYLSVRELEEHLRLTTPDLSCRTATTRSGGG
jgi:hypothetical protein